MREQALALAARGFKIFPLTPGAKSPPLVNDWPRVATTDPAQIESWWIQYPTANIGIHCDGLLVLDVDAHKGGLQTLAELEKEIELEATFEVESPRLGRHIYYHCETPIRNGVDVVGAGIDVRSTAGYVVGPGSRTDSGEYRIVANEPIANADARLVGRCGARVLPDRDRNHEAVHTDVDGAVTRAIDFLRTHPVSVQGQGGDHHVFRTACRLRDFGVPEERALEALADWNARCSPPWEEGELEIKIRNAYEYAQDAPGKLTPEAMGFQDTTAQLAAPVAAAPEEKKPEIELLHPSDVVESDVLQIAYHVKGVLEQQSDAVLFGLWNVGKTFVVLDMAASIACGVPWFGRRVRQGGVLYFGYEGIRALRKRMWALREKYPQLKDPGTPFRYHAMTDPLTLKSGHDELLAALAKFVTVHGIPPALVIIDTLTAALGGDDSDAAKMAELNRVIKNLIRKKYTVIRVHHTGHGNQERARGHSSLPAGIDTEIRVDAQEIALTKQRDDVRSKAFYKLRVVTVGADTDGDPVTTCVVDEIEANPMSPEIPGPWRDVVDQLLALRGDGGFVTATEIRDCSAEMPANKRREMIAALEKKQYLRADGKGHVLCERGPMAMFDH